MAHQTTLDRGNGRGGTGPDRSVSDLAHDLAEMAELQYRLFGLDCRDATSKAGVPVALLGIGIWFVFATVPLLLFALAWSLIEFAGMPATWAYLIAAGAGALLGGLMLAGAFFGFKRSITPFRRSREEFQRNFEWFKRAVRGRTSEPTSTYPAGRR